MKYMYENGIIVYPIIACCKAVYMHVHIEKLSYQAYGLSYVNRGDLSPLNHHRKVKSVEHEDPLKKVDVI